MAQREEIHLIMELLHKTRPSHVVEKMGEQDVGAMGVIKILADYQEPVKSKAISDSLEISSARMAVLLKKLEGKGLIQKSECPEDARVTLIALSPKGRDLAQKIYNNHYATVEELIEAFGIDYLIRLLEDIARFKVVMERNL